MCLWYYVHKSQTVRLHLTRSQNGLTAAVVLETYDGTGSEQL